MRRLAFAALAIAGLCAAVALTRADTAHAYDITALPAGYTVQHIVTQDATCPDSYYIFGYNHTSPQLCTDSPTFQQDVDSFVSSTCPASVCAPPTTTAPTTDAGTTTAATTTDAGTTPTAPPATTTDVTTTAETVTVTTVDPTVDKRLTALEQRATAVEARITALEQKNGQIIGEQKNVAPFTRAA